MKKLFVLLLIAIGGGIFAQNADVIIPQGGHNNAAINMLVKFIKQELREKK